MQMNNDLVCINLQAIKMRFYAQLNDEEKEAIDLAIKSASQIGYIRGIINYQPAVQEDVFRYKAICKVLNEPTIGGNYNWTDILRDHIQ